MVMAQSKEERARAARTFASPAAWRAWLERHHDVDDAIILRLAKASAKKKHLTYPQALDEALCFGWIDGVSLRLDDDHYAVRFTPRKPGSIWSNVNLGHVERLRAAGKMTDAGERELAKRTDARTGVYSFEQARPTELDDERAARFRAARAAWAFFSSLPPGYRRQCAHWVMSAKRDETRDRRLAQLIADSAAKRRLALLTSPAREKTTKKARAR
jgi:uncharacterized protein YdeI (YjbR/CyaY-like superfamily)